ncbi:unnamed protein product [Amoebophrya sp. A120]|nr:unnamed protein product [Amoebophrya sp. A120]|eukprot:GSA120T00001478001.1
MRMFFTSQRTICHFSRVFAVAHCSFVVFLLGGRTGFPPGAPVEATPLTERPRCFTRVVVTPSKNASARSVWIPIISQEGAVPQQDDAQQGSCPKAAAAFASQLLQDYGAGHVRLHSGLNLTQELDILFDGISTHSTDQQTGQDRATSATYFDVPHTHLRGDPGGPPFGSGEDAGGAEAKSGPVAAGVPYEAPSEQIPISVPLKTIMTAQHEATQNGDHDVPLYLPRLRIESYSSREKTKLHVFTYGDMLNSYLCVLSRLVQQLNGGRLNVLGGSKLRRHSDEVLAAHEQGGNAAGLDFNIRGSKLEQASRLFRHLTGSEFERKSKSAPTSNKESREKEFLAPDDVILLSDGFDVFAQRDLQGLKDTYFDLDSSGGVVYYGGEKNCWPTPHHNITEADFERRNCLVERRCPYDNQRGPWRLYYHFPEEDTPPGDAAATRPSAEDRLTKSSKEEEHQHVQDQHNPYTHKSGGRLSVLGKDLCVQNLNKYSPPGTETTNRFPFLNAGLSIGTVHAIQKLSRRLFQLYKETKQLDDQALLLVLALEEHFVRVEPTGKLFYNAHGYGSGDFADPDQELCTGGYLLKDEGGPAASVEDSKTKMNSGAQHSPALLFGGAKRAGRESVPEKGASELQVTNLASKPQASFLVHFNGRGRWYMQRCREFFFSFGLGTWKGEAVSRIPHEDHMGASSSTAGEDHDQAGSAAPVAQPATQTTSRDQSPPHPQLETDHSYCRLFDYENYEYFDDRVLWGEETVFAINFQAEKAESEHQYSL